MATKHVTYRTAPEHLQGAMRRAYIKAVRAQRQLQDNKIPRRLRYWVRVHKTWQDKFGVALQRLKPWEEAFEVIGEPQCTIGVS